MANEKRLIDANALMRKLDDLTPLGKEADILLRNTRCVLIRLLTEAHTVDAKPVVHGYWIDSHSVDHMGRIVEHGIDCSVCDSVFKDDSREAVKRWKERFKVCPFCGADMRGRKEEK